MPRNIPWPWLVLGLTVASCQVDGPPAPPTPDSFTFFGATEDTNRFTTDAMPLVAAEAPLLADEDDPFSVLMIPVDTFGRRFVAPPVDLQAYLDQAEDLIEAPTSEFWETSSYDKFHVDFTWEGAVHPLAGSFEDYFYAPYVRPKLVSRPLAGLVGKTLSPDTRVDVHSPNFEFSAELGDKVLNSASWLVNQLKQAADAQSPGWEDHAEIFAAGGHLRIRMLDEQAFEGAYIAVSGTGLAEVGLDGPELDFSTGTITSLPVLGGFPLSLFGENVDLEVRDAFGRVRRVTVTPGVGTFSKAQMEQVFLEALNAGGAEWIEAAPADADRLSFRLKPPFGAPISHIRVLEGQGHAVFGLDGPQLDVALSTPETELQIKLPTVEFLSQGVTAYLQSQAAASIGGIDLDSADQQEVAAWVEEQLGEYDGIGLYFMEFGLEQDIAARSRAALSSGYFNVLLQASSDLFLVQQQKAFMIGTGHDDPLAWTHDVGDMIGLEDLRASAWPSSGLPSSAFVNGWGVMGHDVAGAQPCGYTRARAGWLEPVAIHKQPGVENVVELLLAPLDAAPPPQSTVDGSPVTQLIELPTGASSSYLFEWRAPILGGNSGGLLTRLGPEPGQPPVRVVDRGDKAGEWRTADPGVDVLESVTLPGAEHAGKRVRITRSPAPFVDLEIREWERPPYATHDIWIDWPGDGEQTFPGEVPIGNVERPHWHPDGTIPNIVKVRVHNRGDHDATDVVVSCGVVESGIGDEFEDLEDSPSEAFPIPAGEFREYRFVWRPTKKGHFCLKADVVSQGDPGREVDTGNHVGKENVVSFHLKKGSPYVPIDFEVPVRNAGEVPLYVRLFPSGLIDGMDLTLDRTEVRVEPGGEEIVAARLTFPEDRPPAIKYSTAFHLHAWRKTPTTWEPYGGITYNVTPTVASSLLAPETFVRTSDKGVHSLVVRGRLQGTRNGGQRVDVAFVDSAQEVHGAELTTDANGRYTSVFHDVAAGTGSLMVYYFGLDMEPADVGPIAVEIP